jgi:WD40 repeat protein
MGEELTTMKFDAFISYSQSADSGLAPAVQKALHRFAKPWYRMRVLHIFRDQTSLSVTPELWDSIESALSQSRHLLLCASPEAVGSRWVQDEIAWWLKNRTSDGIFILLTGGNILWDPARNDFDWKETTALPRTLSGAFSTQPLYVDMRFTRGVEDLSLRNTPFREAILTLAAPLHGRPKDELGGVDVREHRKTIRIARAAVSVLAVLFISAAITAWIATVQRDLSRSRELAALARNQIEIDPSISLELATNAMEVRPTKEARQMLRTSLLESHVRQVFDKHKNEITLIDVEESGNQVVSVGLDGKMFVWDLTDSRVVHQLAGYRGAVSIDGKRAATSVKGNRLAVWDLSSGEKLLTHGEHADTIFAVAISSDGRLVASGGRDDTVRIYDIETGRAAGEPIPVGGIVTDLVFHPNGRLLVIGSIYNKMTVWDLETDRKFLEASGISAAFSPDGKLLATGGGDNSGGQLIDLETGRAVGSIAEMPGSVRSITFSNDGQFIAAASSDGTARVWRRNGKLVTVLSGHENWVEDVAFSPNGNFVVTGSGDQTARVWSVASGREVATLRGHQAEVTAVYFTPNGRKIVTGAADGSLWVWDAGMANPQAFFPGTKRAVQQIAFTPDGHYVIAADDMGSTEIWDRREDRQVAVLPGTVFSLGTNQLATASDDHVVRLWDMQGSMRAELGSHEDIVSSLAFSPDQSQLVSTSEDGSALLFDVLGNNPPRTIIHEDGLSSAAFSPDGGLLVTADYEGTARLWRLPELTEIAIIRHSDKIISKVDFTTNGDRIITSSWNGTIGVWESAQGVQLLSLDTDLGAVYTFEIFDGGERLIAGGANGNIEIWDINTGRRLAKLQGHTGGIYDIALSHDMMLAASASNDGTARLWDLQTAQEIADFTVHGGPVWAVSFSPDGKFIATGSEDGNTHIYECTICASDEELMATARKRLSLSWKEEEP